MIQRTSPARSRQPNLKTSSSRKPSQRSRSRCVPRPGSSMLAAMAQALMAPTLVPQKMRGTARGPSFGASTPKT